MLVGTGGCGTLVLFYNGIKYMLVFSILYYFVAKLIG
jgi:hypothetical protein